MTELFEKIIENNPQKLVELSFGVGIFIALFAAGVCLLLLFFFFLVNALMDFLDRKADRKRYLQTHRFDRFRVLQFGKDKFEIFEYIGADNPPYSVLYCNDFRNADKICQILNCDFLGEQYTEKKFLKLDDFYTKRLLKEVSTRNRAEDINNLKDPQKEGERK